MESRYWPVIDDALRSAAIDRHVSVKLLISWWKHSRPSEDYFLRSLAALSNAYRGVDIEVVSRLIYRSFQSKFKWNKYKNLSLLLFYLPQKRFICPATDDQAQIPFGRVNHNKYMVTDNVAYIGTSNWSADYFITTAGIGLVMAENSNIGKNKTANTIRDDLASVFERDWTSAYAVNLTIPNAF